MNTVGGTRLSRPPGKRGNMNILIKGMEMPKSCVDCKVAVTVNDGVLCTQMFRIVKEKILSERQQDCPLVEAPEQKHGHWIVKTVIPKSQFQEQYREITCSVCKAHVPWPTKFCSQCGAKMRGNPDV